MGYTTEFTGRLEIEPPLTAAQTDYIRKFRRTRRMKRRPDVCETISDSVRTAAALPVGQDGAYFTAGLPETAIEDGQLTLPMLKDKSVVDHNRPPDGQPGLWCQWTVAKDGRYLHWDGGEKFYHYVEWLHYLIDHFFQRWGRTLTGHIEWQGDEPSDCGIIKMVNNAITVLKGDHQMSGEGSDGSSSSGDG